MQENKTLDQVLDDHGLTREDLDKPIERHDDWRTPDAIFGPLNAVFHFDLDAAADSDNAKTCEFINEHNDALKQSWADWSGARVWVNPPYKNLFPWVAKAALEARKGCTVVMLIPNSRDTKWFHHIIVPAKRAGYCRTYSYRGRIRFDDPHPGAKRQAPKQGNMLLVFTPPMPDCWALD